MNVLILKKDRDGGEMDEKAQLQFNRHTGLSNMRTFDN